MAGKCQGAPGPFRPLPQALTLCAHPTSKDPDGMGTQSKGMGSPCPCRNPVPPLPNDCPALSPHPDTVGTASVGSLGTGAKLLPQRPQLEENKPHSRPHPSSPKVNFPGGRWSCKHLFSRCKCSWPGESVQQTACCVHTGTHGHTRARTHAHSLPGTAVLTNKLF